MSMPELPDSQKPLIDAIAAVRSRVQALEAHARFAIDYLDGDVPPLREHKILDSIREVYEELDRLQALVFAEVVS
jgi:hypothetical protein